MKHCFKFFSSLLIILPFMCSITTANAFDVKTDNLSRVKSILNQYVDSHQYTKDLSQVTQRAQVTLTKSVQAHLALKHSKPLAIVFDIDETLLSNYPMMRHYAYGGDQPLFDRFAAQADAPLIEPTAQLYHQALQQGIHVFLITGRPAFLRQATIDNLKRHGLNHWDALMLLPKNNRLTIGAFKTASRKKIVKQGYTIIMNVGDQLSDLVGGYSQSRVKLPNPFYLIPADQRRIESAHSFLHKRSA